MPTAARLERFNQKSLDTASLNFALIIIVNATTVGYEKVQQSGEARLLQVRRMTRR